MAFDAHDRAFGFFKGACTRGIYDNMKKRWTRSSSARTASTIAASSRCARTTSSSRSPARRLRAHEKGQVENQVGLVRERFLTPRLRVKSCHELNAWLVDKCVVWAKARAHPEQSGRTIWDVFEEERPKLIPYGGRFDGFHALPAPVSKTCRASKFTQLAQAQLLCASTTTDIRSTPAPSAARSTSTPTPTASSFARTGGLSRSTRARSAAARSSTIPGITCRSWRASPAPCATARRSGTGRRPRRWTASSASSQVPTTATGSSSRLVLGLDPRILAAVLSDGLPAVEAACAQALAENVHSADVVLNILARRRDPGPAPPIHAPAALSLRHAPVADCARYDTIRSA
jgi:hypothetical protein